MMTKVSFPIVIFTSLVIIVILCTDIMSSTKSSNVIERAIEHHSFHRQLLDSYIRNVPVEELKAEAKVEDDELIKQIATFPNSTEKRVIAYALYGTGLKYTKGAIRNAEFVKTYFPGWVCRFYTATNVPAEVVTKLKSLGAEIIVTDDGNSYSGMFHRFSIATDPSVDRFIIRDVDSRLNARERVAVEEWITSKMPIHVMRDHLNHCHEMNGGMWGGVKGSLPHMQEDLQKWMKEKNYGWDMGFLQSIVWGRVGNVSFGHDAYCCLRYPNNTRAFPTRRPVTYQHVGQVFDENDHWRVKDINAFIKNVRVPAKCIHPDHPDWIYG